MNVKRSSFFYILMLTLLKSRKTSKFAPKKASTPKFAVLANFKVLSPNHFHETQFAIILFRKESKSEIKIKIPAFLN